MADRVCAEADRGTTPPVASLATTRLLPKLAARRRSAPRQVPLERGRCVLMLVADAAARHGVARRGDLPDRVVAGTAIRADRLGAVCFALEFEVHRRASAQRYEVLAFQPGHAEATDAPVLEMIRADRTYVERLPRHVRILLLTCRQRPGRHLIAVVARHPVRVPRPADRAGRSEKFGTGPCRHRIAFGVPTLVDQPDTGEGRCAGAVAPLHVPRLAGLHRAAPAAAARRPRGHLRPLRNAESVRDADVADDEDDRPNVVLGDVAAELLLG